MLTAVRVLCSSLNFVKFGICKCWTIAVLDSSDVSASTKFWRDCMQIEGPDLAAEKRVSADRARFLLRPRQRPHVSGEQGPERASSALLTRIFTCSAIRECFAPSWCDYQHSLSRKH